MLKNLLFWLLPTFRAEQVYRISQQAVAMLLIIGCVLFSLKIGFLPLIALGFLLRKARSENPLANRSGFRYNRSNTNKGVRL